MNYKTITLLLLLAACKGSEKQPQIDPAIEPDTIQHLGDSIVMFGKKVGDTVLVSKDAIPAEKLYASMAGKDSLIVSVYGEVDAVCQKAGCWLRVKADDGKTVMAYTAEEFSFDTDIAGRKVLLNGYARWDVTTEAELKHFAEDENKSKEEIAAIKGDKKELSYYIKGASVL